MMYTKEKGNTPLSFTYDYKIAYKIYFNVHLNIVMYLCMHNA